MLIYLESTPEVGRLCEGHTQTKSVQPKFDWGDHLAGKSKPIPGRNISIHGPFSVNNHLL